MIVNLCTLELRLALTRSLVLVLVLVALSLLGCSVSYSTQHFSFPPDSRPHKGDWQLHGVVRMMERRTWLGIRAPKGVVQITIVDQSEKVVLEDEVQVDSARLLADVRWNALSEISVDILDAPSDSRGARPLICTLKYRQNHSSGRFVKEATSTSCDK